MVGLFEASQASQVPVLERVVTALREESVDSATAKHLRRVVRLCDQSLDALSSLAVNAAEVDGQRVADNTAEICRHLALVAKQLKEIPISASVLTVPASLADLGPIAEKLKQAGLQTAADYRKLRKDRDYTDYNRLPPPLSDALRQVIDDLEPDYQRLRQDAFTKGGLQELTADSPVPFEAKNLDRDAYFRIVTARFRGQERMQEYIATLRLRIHRILVDKRWAVFTSSGPDNLNSLIRQFHGGAERVVIIDCSMLSHDVLPFFCAVVARLILDLRTHSRPSSRIDQPYVLVLEEAHNYIRPVREGESAGLRLSRETFERIAKEGRKLGLSLMIASQRPSDVSPTVLSQCANFLVHRIQNPEDIEYFKKILPTGSRDILDQLPILAPGDGLLLGSAVNVPARIKIRKPDPEPSSRTPAPWKAWRREQPAFSVEASIKSWLGRHDA